MCVIFPDACSSSTTPHEVGDEVTKDEPLTTNPNVGGFGQAVTSGPCGTLGFNLRNQPGTLILILEIAGQTGISEKKNGSFEMP